MTKPLATVFTIVARGEKNPGWDEFGIWDIFLHLKYLYNLINLLEHWYQCDRHLLHLSALQFATQVAVISRFYNPTTALNAPWVTNVNITLSE